MAATLVLKRHFITNEDRLKISSEIESYFEKFEEIEIIVEYETKSGDKIQHKVLTLNTPWLKVLSRIPDIKYVYITIKP